MYPFLRSYYSTKKESWKERKKARKRQWGSKSEERKMVGSHGRRVTWGSWAMSLKNTQYRSEQEEERPKVGDGGTIIYLMLLTLLREVL